MTAEPKVEESRAPAIWSIYKEWDEAGPARGSGSGAEYVLYSDSHANGSSGLWGPVSLFSVLPGNPEGSLGPIIIARIMNPDPKKDPAGPVRLPSPSTGLLLEDEMAALLSLQTGARIRTGGHYRVFGAQFDPLGTPNEYGHRAPAWVGPRSGERPRILPCSIDLHQATGILTMLTGLDGLAATTLVRAASRVRDALWIADTDTDLAWQLLISALETAASHWWKKPRSVEVVRTADPELAQILVDQGGDAFLKKVAPSLQHLKGTARFRAFVAEFTPQPFDLRPEPPGQIEWDNLETIFNRIYELRSQGLHGGEPFPQPLGNPPLLNREIRRREPEGYMGPPSREPLSPLPNDAVPLERIPASLLSGEYRDTWTADDAPMYLNTFSRLVREVLITWAKDAVRRGGAGRRIAG
ncbi:hypothetical protein ND748_07675 [Frankia sp. AiPs1]|uniref:hypothetical protein n=1 Tax=Frankia sp. AiPs1 TaxID=573493 RepID=UPI002043D658|nr:hypothetical protein [Frankia sp. AiPs1]MCM3921545.1 hypothetical protein [Frankia sp. AiPs1]